MSGLVTFVVNSVANDGNPSFVDVSMINKFLL